MHNHTVLNVIATLTFDLTPEVFCLRYCLVRAHLPTKIELHPKYWLDGDLDTIFHFAASTFRLVMSSIFNKKGINYFTVRIW